MMRRLIALLMLVAAAAPAAAQQQPPVPVVPYHGVEIFCHLLHHLRFQPLAGVGEMRNANPNETLIVIFGELGGESLSIANLRQASTDPDRSAWLIASDRRTPVIRLANTHLWPWNLTIPDAQVTQDPRWAYRGLVRCPLLKDGLDRGHPIFRGIKQGIATNGPSFLQDRGTHLSRLAAFD